MDKCMLQPVTFVTPYMGVWIEITRNYCTGQGYARHYLHWESRLEFKYASNYNKSRYLSGLNLIGNGFFA